MSLALAPATRQETPAAVVWIGLVALAVAAFLSARAFSKDFEIDRASPARALLAMLVVLILSGITEASPTYLAPENLVMMLLVLLVLVLGLVTSETVTRHVFLLI